MLREPIPPRTPIGKVWGMGPRSVQLLAHHGVRTAYDYIARDKAWVEHLLDKPGREVWNELRGQPVYPWNTEGRSNPLSICKCRTFGIESEQNSSLKREYFGILLCNEDNSRLKTRDEVAWP